MSLTITLPNGNERMPKCFLSANDGPVGYFNTKRHQRSGPERLCDSSEFHFRAQHNLSRIRQQCCGVLTECWTTHHSHRILKIPMIPEVREISADLELPAFLEADLLHQCEVPILK